MRNRGERVWAVTLPPSVKLGRCEKCGQVCEVGNPAYWAAVRRVMGVSRAAVARAAGVSPQMVWAMETGKRGVTAKLERGYGKLWRAWVGARGGEGYGAEKPEGVTAAQVRGRRRVRRLEREIAETVAALETRAEEQEGAPSGVPTVRVGSW